MEDKPFDTGIEDYTPEEYEAIGRAAMGAIQGNIINDGVSIEEYVDRADPEHQEVVRGVLDEIVGPLIRTFGGERGAKSTEES